MTTADADPEPPGFDPATLAELPPPAQRFLAAALPPGVPLSQTIELQMEGEIKLGGRWLPFTAEQVLRAGVGFVWSPTVGGRFLRFTGADALGPDGAQIEFRLHGRIPILRGSGPDITRSAAGRLAAETVAWLPQALTPQAGARWRAIDDERAAVTLDAGGEAVEADVTVDSEGQLGDLELQRWKTSANRPAFAAFGGSVSRLYTTTSGVSIAGQGVVGWDWGGPKQASGEFFRYAISSARVPPIRQHR